MMKLISFDFLMFFVIFITSCGLESESIANLPNIYGYEVKKIYKINNILLATYCDLSGNILVFKLNKRSATWKRVLFKTNASFKH